MLRLLTRLQIAYLCMFAVTCAGVFGFQAYYIWPVQRCEQHGGWWSPKYHSCATPVPIWRITGRAPPAAVAPNAAARP